MAQQINLRRTTTGPTFRDPQGRLHFDGDRILREIYPQYSDTVLAWICSPLAQSWVQQGRLVPTRVVPSDLGQPVLLEHERIFFPSYPWEWVPSQWMDAATLTLDLCEEAIDSGVILKDATPLNVLFTGSRAVFVDALSFENRDLQSPLWTAYAQFVRTFLLPLAAHVYLGWSLTATQQRRDGYEPADLAPYLSPVWRWFSPCRSLVTLPMLFEKLPSAKVRRSQVSEDLSAFTLHRTIRSTRSVLLSLAPSGQSSRWSQYTETASHYKSTDHVTKQAFVCSSLTRIRPARVLDVGANTGMYSRIAAACGADVVAWDTDVQATELSWKAARSAGLSILPLIADFARPTPAVGWQNQENAGLLERSRGKFDCVLMLGILHHLLIVDQIPLSYLLEQLRDLSTRWAIVEWVPKTDSQFGELCRGRQELYDHLNEEYFVRELSTRFEIRDRDRLPNDRTLYLVEVI